MKTGTAVGLGVVAVGATFAALSHARDNNFGTTDMAGFKPILAEASNIARNYNNTPKDLRDRVDFSFSRSGTIRVDLDNADIIPELKTFRSSYTTGSVNQANYLKLSTKDGNSVILKFPFPEHTGEEGSSFTYKEAMRAADLRNAEGELKTKQTLSNGEVRSTWSTVSFSGTLENQIGKVELPNGINESHIWSNTDRRTSFRNSMGKSGDVVSVFVVRDVDISTPSSQK